MTIVAKGKYKGLGRKWCLALELGLSQHQDVETSKGELVVIFLGLGSPNLLLENLEISSPPDFPLLTLLVSWMFGCFH